MHDQKHQTDSTGTPYNDLPGDADQPPKNQSRSELIEGFGRKMRERAFENPIPDLNELNEAIKQGKFSTSIKISPTVGIHVIMTISPADGKNENPFWHCSISIVSMESCKPKSSILFTKTEKRLVKELLSGFLGSAGIVSTQGYMRTKTAFHCHRKLTLEELKQIEWENH